MKAASKDEEEGNGGSELIYRVMLFTILRTRRSLPCTQCFSNPIHLHSTYSPSVAAIGEHILVVHDSLNFLPKEHARRMYSHGLIAYHCLVAAVGKEACSVSCEAFQQALQH